MLLGDRSYNGPGTVQPPGSHHTSLPGADSTMRRAWHQSKAAQACCSSMPCSLRPWHCRDNQPGARNSSLSESKHRTKSPPVAHRWLPAALPVWAKTVPCHIQESSNECASFRVRPLWEGRCDFSVRCGASGLRPPLHGGSPRAQRGVGGVVEKLREPMECRRLWLTRAERC